MRVLMVSDVYFPRVNGVSTAIDTHRRGLPQHGVEVELVVPRYEDESGEPGITRLPGWRVPGDPEDRFVAPHRVRSAVMKAAAQADLIHIQTPFAAHYAGLAAARRFNLPVVATYHTLFEEYLHLYAPMLPESWLRGLARRLSRSQCNALDATIVPSHAMAQRLREYGITAPLQVLPTGVPVGQFSVGDRASHRARFRARYRIPPDQPVALFVGRAAHEKNIGFLIEALAHARCTVPELLLVVAGEGPALESLKERAKALGQADHVRFIGYLDRARELPDCYAAADLFAFASRTETQGLVLIEAMAVGLPVVALAEMGTCDLLGAHQGALVPPCDVGAFGDAMARLTSDSALRSLLGEQARVLARDWSDDALTARMAMLYRDVCLAHATKENTWKAPSKAKQA
ncbi:glycosyltransferase [Niveibacterium sp. 24ML]|uniref:glycosyltransferase n=1 Tax=Niveibacterium sp. 24ML TaxID=2985512 RepID=UPI00226E5D17|nr:glycosyltransferase [Niveibacterium sp. 24ML]MCX9158166.1 glycosyltransferase [Niveibacterium sp. 24ML]